MWRDWSLTKYGIGAWLDVLWGDFQEGKSYIILPNHRSQNTEFLMILIGLYKFDSTQDLEEVMYGVPYFVNRSLILRKMPKFFAFGTGEMANIPIWVKFLNLLVSLRNEMVLYDIAFILSQMQAAWHGIGAMRMTLLKRRQLI